MVTNKRLVQRENWEEVHNGLLTPFFQVTGGGGVDGTRDVSKG